MIDCHAHAFPTVTESLAQISPEAEALARRLGEAVRTGIPEVWKNSLSSLLRRTTISVEQVSRMRKANNLAHTLEPFMTLGALPQVLANAGVDQLLASMERHGISRTVLIAGQPVASNEWTIEQGRRHSDKLVPVVNMPRMADNATDEQWWIEFDRLANEGAKGFKIHLNMDGLDHGHRGYRIAFDVARQRNLFIIIHTGCFHAPGYKNTAPADPALFEPLFRDFPTVRVCLAHMNRDNPEKAWDIQRKYANVWSDTSWQPAESIRQAVLSIGSDRIVLGSDFPLLHGELQGDVIALLSQAVNSTDLEKIGVANAVALIDG